MMYDIYGNAERVCVWLGPEDDESKIAIEFIKRNITRLQEFDELCESGEVSSNWRALHKLMQRPWFSRRWVVQEIALAKSATIYCGGDSISWKDFAIAVELFVEVETATHRLSEVAKKEKREPFEPGWFEHVSALGASLLVDATERLFREYRDDSLSYEYETASDVSDVESDASSDIDGASRVSDLDNAPPGGSKSLSSWVNTSEAKNRPMQPLLSLEYLVSTLTIFDTSVAHDTIYALLAIAKDTTPSAMDKNLSPSFRYARAALELFTQRKSYHVNYDLPYVDVCQEFMKFAIDRSLHTDPNRALDVICRPWATEQSKLSKLNQKNLQKRRKEMKEASRSRKKQCTGETSKANAIRESADKLENTKGDKSLRIL